MTVIGVIGPADDQEAKALVKRLEHRGVEPWLVDLGDFPRAMTVSLGSQGLTLDGRPLLDMDAAYLRRVGNGLPEHLRYDVAPFEGGGVAWGDLHEPSLAALRLERRLQTIRASVLEALARHRPVINPPRDQNLHRLKTAMLRRLDRAGLPLPGFAAGTGREALGDFARRQREGWTGLVAKPLAGIYKTKLWTEERWEAHRWGRRPALYQRYIRGDTVRCYLLEGRLISAARIVHAGTVDSSESQTGIDVLELEPAARAVAEGTAEALGLAFCGMDLMLDGQRGDPFVIDCNLSPMFVNYGRMSGCDVAGHLAEALIARASHREERRPAVLDLVDEAKSLLTGDPELAALLGRRRCRP
jgi:glutathione synthase/RimK-type ligase-like ATP-grasp enzyme